MRERVEGEETELFLASRSPRRARLLGRAGIRFRQGPFPDVDETLDPGLEPPEAVRRLAERKARAALALVPAGRVLAADTLVFLGDLVLGKPRDAADARRMLQLLSGRLHRVATGVALASRAGLTSGVEVAAVTFRTLEAQEIEVYVAGGEGKGKAGAYGLQGTARRFVARLEGDPETVIGLPVALVKRLLASAEDPPRGGLSSSGTPVLESEPDSGR